MPRRVKKACGPIVEVVEKIEIVEFQKTKSWQSHESLTFPCQFLRIAGYLNPHETTMASSFQGRKSINALALHPYYPANRKCLDE